MKIIYNRKLLTTKQNSIKTEFNEKDSNLTNPLEDIVYFRTTLYIIKSTHMNNSPEVNS